MTTCVIIRCAWTPHSISQEFKQVAESIHHVTDLGSSFVALLNKIVYQYRNEEIDFCVVEVLDKCQAYVSLPSGARVT